MSRDGIRTGRLAAAWRGARGLISGGLRCGGALVLAAAPWSSCPGGATPSPRPEPSPAPEASPLELGCAAVLNLVRADPPAFATRLAETRKYYEGNLFRVSPNAVIRTEEGLAAVDEAIRALEAAKPAPHLALSPGLCLAARDHARDQGRTGQTGHEGSDGSTFGSRIERYGTWTGRIGENISYGGGGALDAVMRLVVDDGVPSRGHRTTILNADYLMVGVGCAPHPVYETVCVMDFASEFAAASRATPGPRRGH